MPNLQPEVMVDDPYSQQAAETLITNGDTEHFLKNLASFRITNPHLIAQKMYESDPSRFLMRWFRELPRLGMEITEFQDFLISHGQISFILYHPDLFPNIKYPNIIDHIFSSGKHLEYIYLFWNEFTPFTTSSQYIDELFRHSQTGILFNFLKEHQEVDRQFILEKLKNKGDYGVIFENIHMFSGINQQEVITSAIISGKAFSIISYIDYVDPQYHSLLVKAAMSEKQDTWYGGLLSKAWHLDHTDITKMEPEIFSSVDWIHLFNRLPCFDLSPEEIQSFTDLMVSRHPELLPKILIELWNQHYYDSLNLLMVSESALAIFKAQRLELGDFQRTVDQLIKLGCHDQAEIVSRLAQRIDITLDLSRVQPTLEPEFSKRERYSTIDLVHEIGMFYLYEQLHIQAFDITSRLEYGITNDERQSQEGLAKPRHLEHSRLPDRIALTQIESELQESVTPFVNFIKEYLLLACDRELQHQSLSPLYSVDDNGYSYYLSGTRQQIQSFFLRASEAFIHPHNFPNPIEGGKNWSIVAESGLHLWAAENVAKSVYIVDRIVSLEHNTGHIFDKDYRRINYKHKELTHLLDFRKNTHSFSDLLQYALENKIITEKEAAHLRNIDIQLKQLADFKRSPVRIGPAE